MIGKTVLGFLLILFCSLHTYGQKENVNWFIGDSVHIDFNNIANPIVSVVPNKHNESCSSISKKNGNTLFYISTQSTLGPVPFGALYNSLDSLLENGDSLFYYYSSTNGSLFIPFPTDSNRYYFFYLGYDSFSDSNQLLFYSIIDKTGDSGNGTVSEKNIFLNDSLSEKICAIKHGNGSDWWLITHKNNSNIFIKFLIDNNGITGPFYQNIGSVYYGIGSGEISVSKYGNKIGITCTPGNTDVFDFDRCSGTLSDWKELGVPPYDQIGPTDLLNYACEFSPDENRFYIGRFRDSPPFSDIIQYSVFNENISMTQILDSVPGILLSQFVLAPDNKIYITGVPSAMVIDSSYKFLSVIENPNDSGLSCNLNLFSFYLAGHNSSYGLPNMPNYNLGRLLGSECDTLLDGIRIIDTKKITIEPFYPNPTDESSTLKYQINSGDKAVLIISDVLGRIIGKYLLTDIETEFVLNTQNIADGIYQYNVIVNGNLELSNKLVVIKP